MWREQRTTPCMKVCPIDDGGCLGGSLGADGAIQSRRFDRARCSARVETYWIPGFQKALTALFDETDPARRRMILNGTLFTRTLWSMTYANVSQGQCFECMRVCPVGAERRTLR
jgi:ferredoxin